jgi:hypothetical protein
LTFLYRPTMKPRIFIGSSAEAKAVANAIDANLQGIAEPVVWTRGVFGLSGTTVNELMDQVRNADFGIFVFSQDDTAEIRGKLLNVPRDNVIYELGLFSGALGPERCFFLTPEGADMHLPTDLLGMTGGRYNANRRDVNIKAAMNPFCADVEEKVQKLWYRFRDKHNILRDMATKYECCDWIADQDKRVSKKNEVVSDMERFFRNRRINKKTLAELDFGRTGFYVAIAAAILANPEPRDAQVLLGLKTALLTRGVTQTTMLSAMNKLEDTRMLTVVEKSDLLAWVSKFDRPDPSLQREIDKFRKRQFPPT